MLSMATTQAMNVTVPMPNTASSMISTPSPSPSTATASHNNMARRPPRKSTLTQQQKNQKRQRATQDQLLTLEMEFNKNPTPTAGVRERIAQEINMTERSVQIWFQNRRAKIKNIAKKSIESGEDCNEIPDSMRRYLAIQAAESGNPLGRDLLARASNGAGMFLNPESNSKVVIQHFHCRSLTVGSWRRVGQSAMDLVVFYSPDKACITYYINNDSAGYKIEYPFAYIKNITLETGDPMSDIEGASQRLGGLVVELYRPPNFFMDDSGSGGFFQCGDFTEDHQASRVLVHHLGGYPKVLSGQLAKLVSLDSFQNRHSIVDTSAMTTSAPVSPVHHHRPASQPNHVIHPHNPMLPETPYASNSLHPPRGHKRQRSRSVPATVDLSMLRHPIPSFLIQQDTASSMPPPELYAPIPQHHNSTPGTLNPPPGPGLSIDTSTPFTFEMRHQYPVSAATTANSPSEFGTPAIFTANQAGDAISNPPYSSTYSIPYLSPMPENTMLHPVTSPLSMVSPADPVIANQSPPLAGLERSASADLFSMAHEHGQTGEEALAFGDMYTKGITLPFRAPVDEHHSIDEFGVNPMVGYGTVDPASLKTDTPPLWPSEQVSN